MKLVMSYMALQHRRSHRFFQNHHLCVGVRGCGHEGQSVQPEARPKGKDRYSNVRTWTKLEVDGWKTT